MENLKYVLSYSCGKDSTLALHRMQAMGMKCEELIVTVENNTGKSFFHGVPEDVLVKIEESLGIPIRRLKIGENDYREVFVRELKLLAEKGVMLCVFGDIDIEEHREWCRSVCKDAGIIASFPLWQENREVLVEEFILLGYKAMIKVVNRQHLEEDFLGKILDGDLVRKIIEAGSDACGENGEYHTIVVDGPLFTKSIDLNIKDIVKTHNYSSISM